MKLGENGQLTLTARRPGDPAPVAIAGRTALQAEIQWRLAGPESELDTIASALGSVAEQLAPTLLLLDFGNAVGLVDAPHIGLLEIVSGKWSTADFDQMLTELMEIASGLPYAAGATTGLPYDRTLATRDDVLYHAFVYLKHVILGPSRPEERLLPPLNVVLREPHRRFERFRETVPLDRARRINGGTLAWLAAGGGRPVRVPSALAGGLALTQALHGHLPTEIDERQIRCVHDTPENRFVKAFLGQALGVIDAVRRAAGRTRRPTPFLRTLRDDCDACEQALDPLRRHAFWRQIGPMTYLPAASTILQRRRGYREVFGHFSRLRLASRMPMDREQLQRLLEARDIAELYELWTYFVVVRELTSLLGPPCGATALDVGQFSVGVPRAFQVRWEDGTCASYNVGFSRSKPAAWRSFSVPLRPDIAVEIPHGLNKGLHLFDAKFKLDRVDSLLSASEASEDEDVEERRGTFKRGDLYKMHTYRDAIPRARSVWILYPGDDVRFYPEEAQPVSAAAALPERLTGVGALPLTPDPKGSGALRAALATLIQIGA